MLAMRPYFLLLLLVIIFLFGGIGWRDNLVALVASLGQGKTELEQLRLENQTLKARIWELENSPPLPTDNIIKAQVQTAYPFNNQSLLGLSVGKKQGVAEGMPVTLDGSLLVGQIQEVFANYSLAKTIFSPDWQVPTRIGPKKVPALLLAGPTPKLVMISQEKKINDGEIVFATGQDLPYGLKVGEVVNQRTDESGVFKEAGLQLAYELNDLVELIILPWTPN